jgi:hypothetical protein
MPPRIVAHDGIETPLFHMAPGAWRTSVSASDLSGVAFRDDARIVRDRALLSMALPSTVLDNYCANYVQVVYSGAGR